MDIYVVTRMSTNKCDVPNLGVHLHKEEAYKHFDGILEDRKGKNKSYKCNVVWDHEPVLRSVDVSGVIREAYIEHPKSKFEPDGYREMLRVEWYHKDVNIKDYFLEEL